MPSSWGADDGTDPRSTTLADPQATIELAKWHVSRFDQLRVSVANRATAVLSANALILAGFAVFVGQSLGTRLPGTHGVQVAATLGALLTLVLSCLSVAWATSALQNFRSWRRMFEADIPPALFFNHGDTFKEFENFSRFKDTFAAYRYEDVLEGALVELWVGIRLHRQRYRRLRTAIRLMLGAVASFMITATMSILVTF